MTTKTKLKKVPRFVPIKSRDNKFYGVVCVENPRTGKGKLLYKTAIIGNDSENADNETIMHKIAGMLNVKTTCEDASIVSQVNTQLEAFKHLLTI
ncbi:hypothetical protein [Paludibacter sp.]|uniref:hypothetical protein n=1 Tax=Paludibacter sp. TaxID=1898105 RepID=UPI001352CF57|nr:hypothetical protein [Paludibacter sp.]MTK53315.1 hypothetical protein [Paludibacter sp.]